MDIHFTWATSKLLFNPYSALSWDNQLLPGLPMSIVAITYLRYVRFISDMAIGILVRRVGTDQRQASQWARRKKETMRRERMTAEYWEKRSIFCKNLSRGTIWTGEVLTWQS